MLCLNLGTSVGYLYFQFSLHKSILMPIMIKNIFDYEYLDDEFSQKSKR